ncbi:unnamed protein product, partial [Musa banksii]
MWLSSGLPGRLGGGGVVEEVEEDGALALGTPGVILGEHDVHEAPGAGGEHHRRRRFWAVGVGRQARARRGLPVADSGGSRPSRRVSSRRRRRRQVQLQVHLLASAAA